MEGKTPVPKVTREYPADRYTAYEEMLNQSTRKMAIFSGEITITFDRAVIKPPRTC